MGDLDDDEEEEDEDDDDDEDEDEEEDEEDDELVWFSATRAYGSRAGEWASSKAWRAEYEIIFHASIAIQSTRQRTLKTSSRKMTTSCRRKR